MFSYSFIFFLYKRISSYVSSNDDFETRERNSSLIELEIIADNQYWKDDNLFIAEGNVKTLLHGRTLKADRIEIDKSNPHPHFY